MVTISEVEALLIDCCFARVGNSNTFVLFNALVVIEDSYLILKLCNYEDLTETHTIIAASYEEFKSTKQLKENLQMYLTNAVESTASYVDLAIHTMKFGKSCVRMEGEYKNTGVALDFLIKDYGNG